MKSISVSTLKAKMNSESKSQAKESSVIISEERRALLNRILTFPEPTTPAFCLHTDGIRTRRIDYRSLWFTNLLNLQADQQERNSETAQQKQSSETDAKDILNSRICWLYYACVKIGRSY
jgi:hypothetical protein